MEGKNNRRWNGGSKQSSLEWRVKITWRVKTTIVGMEGKNNLEGKNNHRWNGE